MLCYAVIIIIIPLLLLLLLIIIYIYIYIYICALTHLLRNPSTLHQDTVNVVLLAILFRTAYAYKGVN